MRFKKTPQTHRPIFAPPRPIQKKHWLSQLGAWGIKSFKRLCFGIGLMFVVLIVWVSILSAQLSGGGKAMPLPKDIVLYLQLDQTLQERAEAGGLSDPFKEPALTLAQIIASLDQAKSDDRVKGLFLRLKSGGHSLAHLQELRQAIMRFRQSGKFAYIYATSYGQGAGGLGRFYLASAFDERWMQPLGIVSIAGIRAEVPYAREALDKIGVQPQFFQRKEYKTAYESLSEYQMSPENREVLKQMIANMRVAVLADILPALNMPEAAFDTLVDQGILTAPQALEEGLITHADYVDVLIAQIKEQVLGENVDEQDHSLFVPARRYLAAISQKPAQGSKPEVALIYADGAIMDGPARGDIVSAEEVAPAILKAAYDERIKAIVLRVNSPGGSPAASESILRAVQRAQEKGKKVIVSMGSVAASGGYWISAYADQIFAMPTTLTGSIGVVGGKFSAQDLWQNLGITWDKSIQWGDNAGMWSLNTPFSSSEAMAINGMLDHVYDSFIERVASGRNLETAAVESVARGRVWSGEQAKENGLVDQLGGLYEALNYVAKELGVEDKNDIRVVLLPHPKEPLEALIEQLTGGNLFDGFEVIMGFFEKILTYQSLANDNAVLVYDPVMVKD